MPQSKAELVLEEARKLARSNPDWVTFFREILGVAGLVRRHFQTADEIAEFETSEEYAAIQQLLAQLRETAVHAGDDKEPTRVTTVRLPKHLHESLREKANEARTSLNQLCISALLQSVDVVPFQELDSDVKDVTRVITCRMPKSLHQALLAEADERKTSMNFLLLQKLRFFNSLESRELPNRVPSTETGHLSSLSDAPPFTFLLDPGTASSNEIAELYVELSKLYQMLGGRGIQFSVVDAREPIHSETYHG